MDSGKCLQTAEGFGPSSAPDCFQSALEEQAKVPKQLSSEVKGAREELFSSNNHAISQHHSPVNRKVLNTELERFELVN